jgi:hypothetical protein
MIELVGNIITVIGPAGIAYWLFADPWIAGVWAVVGLTVRWYRRHWHKPPYEGGKKNSGE